MSKPLFSRPGTYKRSTSHLSTIDRSNDLIRRVKNLELSFRASSMLTDRANFAQSYASHTYGGNRDMYGALGYPESRNLTTKDYFEKYYRGDIAATVVSFYPTATWDDEIKIVEDKENTEPTEFDLAVEELWEKHHLWSVLMRADIMACLGQDGWSAILIGCDDTNNYSLPMDKGELLYLAPYSQMKVSVSAESKVNDYRFGLPDQYSISGVTSGKIHWSRIIHVTPSPFDSRYRGIPSLQKVWNRLIDLEKLVGGGSEACWRSMTQKRIFSVDPDPKGGEISDQELKAFEDQVNELEHGLRDHILTIGGNTHALSVPNIQFSSNAQMIIDLIAGSANVPKRFLMGSERGELSAGQYVTLVREVTRERQIEFAEPLIRDIVDRFIGMGVLPQVESYDVVLPTIDTLTELEKAELSERISRANDLQKKSEGNIVLTSDEIRMWVWGREKLDNSTNIRSAAEVEEPEYKVIHQVADSHVDPLADAIINIFDSAFPLTTTIDTIEFQITGNLNAAFSELMPAQLLEIANDAGKTVLDFYKQRKSFFRAARSSTFRSLEIDLVFNDQNPAAIVWAEIRSSTLITEITPDTQEAIRQIISRGQASQLSSQEIISEIRQMVGLRSDQVDALFGYMDRLDAARPGDVVFMGVDQGKDVYVTIPKTGVTKTFRTAQYNRYAKQLRLQRARLIARTETIRSANEGQKFLWFQARDAGQLPTSAKRIWISTPDERTRETHMSWDGAIAEIDGPFPHGVEPGEEANCRCAQGLTQ